MAKQIFPPTPLPETFIPEDVIGQPENTLLNETSIRLLEFFNERYTTFNYSATTFVYKVNSTMEEIRTALIDEEEILTESNFFAYISFAYYNEEYSLVILSLF